MLQSDQVTIFYNLDGHSVRDYEKSHGPRLDFLIEDLKLNDIKNSTIIDFGCGYGQLLNRLKKENENNLIGVDGCPPNHKEEHRYLHLMFDLNNEFELGHLYPKADFAFCFETLEHLTNPYNLMCSIKNCLKKDGVLYLSIPHQDCTHNAPYPGLLYPVENFEEFLGQMAFEILDKRIHRKCFAQHVFTLKNKDWSYVKMKWHKSEDKFRNKTPLEQINL